MTDIDQIYRIAQTMSKLSINNDFKIFKNGTIMLDSWEQNNSETVPEIDYKFAMGNKLNMFLQADPQKGGLGCHLLTMCDNIEDAQKLINEDINNKTVIFNSRTDDLSSYLTEMYVFVHSDIIKTNVVANVSCQVMKTVVDDHYKNPNNYAYNVWSELGSNVKIFRATADELKELSERDNSFKIVDPRRKSSTFGEPVCVALRPDFMNKLPSVSQREEV